MDKNNTADRESNIVLQFYSLFIAVQNLVISHSIQSYIGIE